MKLFAELLDRLAYTPGRNAKLRLMQRYFQTTPDPDRGYALAALTDGLPFSFPVRRTITSLVTRRLEPELFRLSRDYVGDTAETLALAWPEPAVPVVPPRLCELVAELELMDRNALEMRLEAWLDGLRCDRSLGTAEAADRCAARRGIGQVGQDCCGRNGQQARR